MELSKRIPEVSVKYSRPLDPNAGSFFPGKRYNPTRKSPPYPSDRYSYSVFSAESSVSEGFNCDNLLEALNSNEQHDGMGRSILQDVKEFMEKGMTPSTNHYDGEIYCPFPDYKEYFEDEEAAQELISRTDEETAPELEELREDDEEEDEERVPKEGPDLEIYKRIAQINGAINRMNSPEIRRRLHKLQLNAHGNKEVISKRLKDFYKKKKQAQLSTAQYSLPRRNHYDYLLIVDFEATCEEPNPGDFVHEIIEFPAVLLDLRTKEVESEFQEYVRPEINPVLSEFCKELTGITQEMVDNADTFPKVFAHFEEWLSRRKLGPRSNYALVTDGTSDLAKFMYMQCKSSQVSYPQYARKWINVKKLFSCHYKLGKNPLSVMLAQCGLEFQGRPHCGLNDAQNIAQLVLRLMEDGAVVCVNEYLIIQQNAKQSRRPPNLRQLWGEVRVVPVTRKQAIRFVKEEKYLAEAKA